MNGPRQDDQSERPETDESLSSMEETNQFLHNANTDEMSLSSFSMMGSVELSSSDQEPKPPQTGPKLDMGIGDRLGKYEIRRILGRGGMGAVYLAFDPMIEREVAIKVIQAPAGGTSIAFERFLSEARATGKLNHSNVVAIYDIDRQDDICYIVMECVRGGSGNDFIANRENIDWREAVRITANAADGLAVAHAAGLIHRDIKPENLMLTEDGLAKVVDFGLSKLVDDQSESKLNLTGEGQLLGTPRYMSPEQFQGSDVDARSDVYGLGGTLYTFLTGQPPYSDANNLVQVMRAHVSSPPPDPKRFNSEIPDECKRIVHKSMAKHPQDRYQDAGELASDLWNLLQDTLEQRRPPAQDYRKCSNVLIAEPSRMQGMVFAKQLAQFGVDQVMVKAKLLDIENIVKEQTPDLIISAMQLEDGNGVDLIDDLSKSPAMKKTALFLHTSDVDIEPLTEISHSSAIGVVSKSTKTPDILKALVGCTYLEFASIKSASANEVSLRKIGIVGDSPQLPESLAELVRESKVLDLNVVTFDELASGNKSLDDRELILAWRNAGQTKGDQKMYREILDRLKPLPEQTCVSIQITQDELILRAFQHGLFGALAICPLDISRWKKILSCSGP